jgi:hypothetical protein
MKVGDLVSHKRWGKGIVIEKCFRLRGDRYPPVVRVMWNKPEFARDGTKRAILRIHEQELTTISGAE